MNFKLLSAATLGVAALVTLSNAHAGFYGRVTYNIVGGDTASDDIEFQRHGFAETTFGGKGSMKVGDLTLGANVELGLNDGNVSGYTGGNTRNRIQDMYVSGDFGKVSVGRGNLPSNVIDSIDSSGTWLADPSGWLSRAGAGGGAGHSTAVHSLFRADRLRYDAPKLGGVANVAVAILENGGSDISLKVNTNGFKFGAWSSTDGTGAAERDITGVILGYKHASGVSITATSSESEQGGASQDLTSVKLGYQTGANAFSFQTNEVDGGSTLNSLTFQRKVAKGAFMWVRSASAEDTATEDSVIALGGMIKF